MYFNDSDAACGVSTSVEGEFMIKMGKLFIGYRTLATVCLPAIMVIGFFHAAVAQVNVTETFDVGVGTRFDLFLNNDVTRPKPVSMNDPADDTVIKNAFGGTRTVVTDGNILTNHFGLTYTQNAGGQGAGEFGGEFNWFDEGAVADTTLGGTLNHSEPVVIKAKMRLDDIGLDNDQRVVLGYFNLPASPVTTDFDRGKISAGVAFVGGARFLLQINGNNSGAINIPGGYDPDTGVTSQFDVDLTLHFDSGASKAWFEGSVAGIPINQFTFSQTADALHPFNSFAISQSFLRESQDAMRRGAAWIDDLTYSAATDLGIDSPNPVRLGSPPIIALQGDYNGNGVVDAADYVLWRDLFGSTGAPGSLAADGTGSDLSGVPDGVVDHFDFDFWRSKFGNTSNGSGASTFGANVPEPSAGLLFIVASLCLTGLKRSRC
jgi:hypothetical protein